MPTHNACAVNYVAAVAKVKVKVSTGTFRVTKFFIAHDGEQIVNSGGLKNQSAGRPECLLRKSIGATFGNSLGCPTAAVRRWQLWSMAVLKRPPNLIARDIVGCQFRCSATLGTLNATAERTRLRSPVAIYASSTGAWMREILTHTATLK